MPGLTDIDRHFADFIENLEGERDQSLWLAAALTSHATQNGHVCLDLSRVAGRKKVEELIEIGEELALPDLTSWLERLYRSNPVGSPGDYQPLILDQANRLYLYRYWQYEKRLADYLLRWEWLVESVDFNLLKDGINRWFASSELPDMQRVAAWVAVCSSLCIITGGPGTGKTSTVVRILALLLEQSKRNPLRIALAAPTGKAAARLRESVEAGKEKLFRDSDELSRMLPREAFTLHRLLGIREGATHPQYNEALPLPYDVVVVDEASMVDLPLMSKLVSAIPPDGRLILLGDRNQLASVEPGAIFGDICTGLGLSEARHEFDRRADLREPPDIIRQMDFGGDTELPTPVVSFTRNYRFDERSRLGRLSIAINDGDGGRSLDIISEDGNDELVWHDTADISELEKRIQYLASQQFVTYLKADSIAEAFAAFSGFRVLCALRVGPYGVNSVNSLIENKLTITGQIHPRGRWYKGQPILITQNDYRLRLFNGDIGLIFPGTRNREAGGESLRAHFPGDGERYREFLPARLTEYETAFAMTVHKSQGSEFEKVLLILPPQASEILTRELIYTAVTRARKSVEIWGNREVFVQAIARRAQRSSGLRDALLKKPSPGK